MDLDNNTEVDDLEDEHVLTVGRVVILLVLIVFFFIPVLMYAGVIPVPFGR